MGEFPAKIDCPTPNFSLFHLTSSLLHLSILRLRQIRNFQVQEGKQPPVTKQQTDTRLGLLGESSPKIGMPSLSDPNPIFSQFLSLFWTHSPFFSGQVGPIG